MAEFLGLDEKTLSSLKIARVENTGNCSVDFSTKSHDILCVKHKINLDGLPRDKSRYISCLCHTGRPNAGDVAEVEFRTGSGSERLGYAFPATSFSEPDVLSGGWVSNFAEAAFRKNVTIENISIFSPLKLGSEEKEIGERSFDEVFPEDLSVLSLCIDAIKKLKISLLELEMSLLAAGIYPVMTSDSYRGRASTHISTGRYKLRPISHHFKHDLGLFLKLFQRADQDPTSVGAFLSYYQVVEYCIAYILGWSVREIGSTDLDAWRLRDALNEAANEKKRFNKLYSNHMSSFCDRSSFEALRLATLPFLEKFEGEEVASWSWPEAVYKTRNIIVHNQLSIFRSDSFDQISVINKELRRACLEILTSFVKEN